MIKQDKTNKQAEGKKVKGKNIRNTYKPISPPNSHNDTKLETIIYT